MRFPFPIHLRMALIALGLVTGQASAHAEDAYDRRRDHDLARQGQMQRAIIPLKTVLEAVRQQFPGDIAGIELEHENGSWLYEIKVISPAGVMKEVHVDGRTGAIVPGRSDADTDGRGR